MNRIYYDLFMRNWVNNTATIGNIDQAVTMKYITPEQGETIKVTEQNPLNAA